MPPAGRSDARRGSRFGGAKPLIRRIEAPILRKQADLPAYVVVPAAIAFRAAGAHAVAVSIDGGPPFRRTLKEMGDGSWFFDLTAPQMKGAGVSVGQTCRFALEAAPEAPDDLLAALDAAGLRAAWDALRPHDRRQRAEAVFAAARPATRADRIARILADLG